jgi:hypothetical protein
MLEQFDRRVNLEREDWTQPVNLGAFSDAGQRDMAIEAGSTGSTTSHAPRCRARITTIGLPSETSI